ncbi:MAG: hypothetical protein HFF34_00365 [Oscillospiraceae bacterium]|jgi:hypothetical protein|nr:hypothetical protein [Oscillospiraceae bacterium]MCI9579811.1 hypothetical protein [Oscillospiraceae bacterium]
MHTHYEWLCNNYLAPKLRKHSFPDYVQQDKNRLEQLLSSLPNDDKRDAIDAIMRLQEDYSYTAFTYGVQFGISLMAQTL